MAFNTNGAATAGPKGLFSIDPLDVRLQVKTKAALNDIKAGTVYESIHVFCQEDKKFYTPKNYSTTAADANVTWEEVKYGGTWGSISGTLSDQTDLNTELTGLQTQIDNLSGRGRFLSLWNCAEGKPTTEPEYEEAYTYKTGDYFIVGAVASGEAKNYKPTGTTYTKGQAASTVEETDEVSVDDTYYYDGSAWHLQVNHGKTVSFANLAGQPSDNTALATALNAKQDELTQGENISITTGEDGTVTISATDTTYTQGTGITIDASDNNKISVTDYSTIVSNASAGASAATTISGYGDIVTHNASEFITDISGKQDVLTSDNAGTNVSITTGESGKVVISATDTTYSQGTGITIDTNNQISANIATTTAAGIMKPDGTTITVTEDGTISATAQESFFRGKFTTWANVPTSTELYNIDYRGSRIPTESDYMIVEDAEDYPVGEFSKEYKFVITGGGVNDAKLEVFDSNNLLIKSIAFGANVNKTFEIDNKLSIFVDGGAVHGWNINAIDDAKYNDHIYLAGERVVRVRRSDSLNASIFVNSGEVVKLLGAWRFAYHGTWSTDGKQKWLPEYQIKDILPIATDTSAGIVKPDGVSITVDTDGTLKATAQETNYRGRWANYNAIPTDYTLYPEDSHGNKKPTYNDFVVVTDASDYVSPTNLNHGLKITNLHATKAFTLLVIDEFDTANEYYYNDGFSRTWKAINDYYSLRYDPGVPGIWYIKTNKPEDTKIIVKNETYDGNDGTVLCYTNEPATQFSAGLPGATGQFQGTWRFAYYSEWDVDGRAGWKPQYQIENTLPIATTTNPGIVKPDGTTITVATDGTLTATAQESHYRGKWNSWADVPSVDTSYPEDYHGETTPTENDYIVVSNTSDFPVTDYNDSFEYSTNGYGHAYVTYQGETLNIPLKNGESFSWNNKVEFTNNATVCVPKNISGSAMKINDVVYQNNQNLPRALTQVKAYCITPLQGSWRFAYHGTWDTDNKNGWTPEYQLEDVLPTASTTQLGGVMVDGTTITVDTDGKITAEATINTNENVENGVVYDWIGTLEEYEALESYDNNKVYFITDDDEDIQHNQLWGRSENNAHPISAITGLEEALANSTANIKLKEGYGIGIQYPAKLPAGYTQLEYVESNGTQGIDTGIKYVSGDAVYCDFIILDNKYTSGGDQGGIFGCYHVHGINTLCLERFQNLNFYMSVAGTTKKTNITRFYKNKRYNILFDDCKYYINNVLTETFDKTTYFPDGTETAETLGFCCYKTNSYQAPSEWNLTPIKIPLARFYEYWHADSDGNKKVHLVPAKDPDGVVGFYDLVSEEFKPSEIGTPFTAGPTLDSYVVNALVKTSDNNLVRVDYDYKMPEGYTRLEYIENNGKQYIDTEVTHSATDNVIAKVTLDPYKMVSESGSYLGAKVFGATYREDVNKIKCGICVDTDANGSGGFLVQVTKTPVQDASGSTVEDKYRVATLEFQNQSFDFESNNNSFYLSGVKVRSVRWAGVGNPDTFTTRNTIKLFAMHDQTSSGSAGIYTYGNEKGVRFYYYKHFDRFHNAKSILYPARRDSDGALGMYDFVNNVFHPNANANETATFIAGPIIIEDKGSPVVISTNVKLGEGLSFQTPEYDSMTDAKELVVDKNKALVNYPTAGERTFYDARGAYYYGSDTPSAPDWAAKFTDQTIIGDKASGGANYTTALGATARATGEYNIGIGYGSNAGGHGASIAIGRGATIKTESGNPSSQYCIAMGPSSLASRAYDIAIGCGSNATNAQDSIAIGHSATAKEQDSIVIGHSAQTELFTSTSTSLAGSVVMGYYAQGTRQDVVIGCQAKDQNLPSSTSTVISRGYSIIMGTYAKVVGAESISIGKNARTNGRLNIAIGCNSLAGSTSTTQYYSDQLGSIALGYAAKSTGINSVCIGSTAHNSSTEPTASGNYSVAIGYQAQATAANAIQLGQGTNGDNKSLHVYEYELFDGLTGKIPLARLYTLSGATAADDGDAGIVPQPNAGDQNKYLRGDGTWQTINTATSLTALTDTDISNPQDNHALVYSSAQGKWVNKKAGVEATYDATNFRIKFA